MVEQYDLTEGPQSCGDWNGRQTEVLGPYSSRSNKGQIGPIHGDSPLPSPVLTKLKTIWSLISVFPLATRPVEKSG